MSKAAALFKAAKKGDTERVIELLDENGINPNEVDSKTGRGLIHIAIEN